MQGPDQSEGQAALRREVRQILAAEDLRGYVCEERWIKTSKDAEVKLPKWEHLALAAEIMKVALIAAAVLLLIWALHRYRDKLAALLPARKAAHATEVGGLDIRPESLPSDVVAQVLALWAQGARREALALLYRATISRLVSQDGVLLGQGATEGDCLRHAHGALKRGGLAPERLAVVARATELWQNGAYGDRWPDRATVEESCQAWQTQYGAGPQGAQA